MRFMIIRNILLGISMAVSLLLAAGIYWHASERQYVEMTNLALRLRVLQETILDSEKRDQGDSPAREMSWKPMITAMQFEAKHAFSGMQGIHLSRPMIEQLSRFSEEDIASTADLRAMLSRLDLSTDTIGSKAPIVFSKNAQTGSSLMVARFREEITGVVSSDAAYSEWLSPILRQQQSLDRAVICKTQSEVDAFQAFTDKLQSRCASTRNNWSACGGKSEPIIRHMKELQLSLETNLAKFKSRWPFRDVENLCSAS